MKILGFTVRTLQDKYKLLQKLKTYRLEFGYVLHKSNPNWTVKLPDREQIDAQRFGHVYKVTIANMCSYIGMKTHSYTKLGGLSTDTSRYCGSGSLWLEILSFTAFQNSNDLRNLLKYEVLSYADTLEDLARLEKLHTDSVNAKHSETFANLVDGGYEGYNGNQNAKSRKLQSAGSKLKWSEGGCLRESSKAMWSDPEFLSSFKNTRKSRGLDKLLGEMQAKPVVRVLSKDSIKWYPSAAEASASLGVSPSCIQDAVNGVQKTAVGSFWRRATDEETNTYADNYEPYRPSKSELKTLKAKNKERSHCTNVRPVVGKDYQGLETWYRSSNEAGRLTAGNRSCINDCCRGVSKTSGKMTWRYATEEENSRFEGLTHCILKD